MLIDGLQCGHFSPKAFQDLRRGGVSCVTVTCGFWEGAVETMDMFARWREMAHLNGKSIRIVRTVEEIRKAADDDRTAIILGAQNSELLGGRIAFVELFAEMGLRVMQLTYNTQNHVGSSCYEPTDSGLTRFGREVIGEMNQAGVLVDLSHVGNRTSLDTIRISKKPVAVTHANPYSLYAHKRNKTDDVLHALRDTGGILGCATYRNIVGDEHCASPRKWAEMVARAVEIVGIDHIAIGTDFEHDHTVTDLLWMRKGRWTREEGYGAGNLAKLVPAAPPDWFITVDQIAAIPPALSDVGFSKAEVDKITHGNWLRIYGAVFPH